MCSDLESSNSSLLAGAQAKTLASSFFCTLTSSLRGNCSFYFLKSIHRLYSTTTTLFQAIITSFFNYCRASDRPACFNSALCNLSSSPLPDRRFNIRIIPCISLQFKILPKACPLLFCELQGHSTAYMAWLLLHL